MTDSVRIVRRAIRHKLPARLKHRFKLASEARELRMLEVAKLAWGKLKGPTEISRTLGISKVMVERDLRFLREEFLQNSQQGRTLALAEHVAKLLAMEAEAMAQYDQAETAMQRMGWFDRRREVLRDLGKIRGLETLGGILVGEDKQGQRFALVLTDPRSLKP